MFECSRCDRWFNSERGREQHEEAVHPWFDCRDCTKSFRSEHARYQHERDVHPPVFTCSHCDREFDLEDARDQHQRDAHRPKVFRCGQCDRSFGTEAGRDAHSHAVHPEPVVFDCRDCNRTFRSASARDQHWRDSHDQDDEDGSDGYDSYEDEEEEEESEEGWLPNAPVDTPGYWAERADFAGRKSFGYYICDGCEHRWMSAHSFPQYTQDCQDCETAMLPHWLWVNLQKDDRDPNKLVNLEGPHDRARCEACQHGECLARKDSDY